MPAALRRRLRGSFALTRVAGASMLGAMLLPTRVSVVIVLLATAAFSQFAPPGLLELAQSASVICTGVVTGQRSGWDRSHRLILTHTELQVEHCAKGTARGRLTITEVGGQVGRRTLENPGRAHYRVGEAYLVFLTPRETGGLRTSYGPLGRVVLRGEARELERPLLIDGRPLTRLDEVLALLRERSR